MKRLESSNKQLTKLKEINKKNPHLKIKYSEFLLRIVDIRREVRAEDIFGAFSRIDSDGTGTIDAKDIQNFLLRKGNGVTEKEAAEMIKAVDSKISRTTSGETKRKEKDDEPDQPKKTPKELDYVMFKKYL